MDAGALTADGVASMQTAFGIDLLHRVCDQAQGENLLLSPTSAAEALSLLYPAGRGETADAGLAHSSVNKLLRRHSVATRRRGLTAAAVGRAADLYKAAESMRTIAEHLGVGASTVKGLW